MTLVSVLLMTVPVLGDDDKAETKANLTKSSDISADIRPGLGGMTLGAPGKQENPTVAERKPTLLTPTPTKPAADEADTEKESEKVAGTHDNNSKEADYESETKVNHGVELRSNSSSSFVVSAGDPQTKHSLLDHSNEEEDASGTAEIPSHNSNMHAVSLHEHVERYHQHQGSEEDSEPQQPSLSIHPIEESNVAHSVVVDSGSFPVRLGPNTRVRGSNYNVPVRKPIPIVRQEYENSAPVSFGSGSPDNFGTGQYIHA